MWDEWIVLNLYTCRSDLTNMQVWHKPLAQARAAARRGPCFNTPCSIDFWRSESCIVNNSLLQWLFVSYSDCFGTNQVAHPDYSQEPKQPSTHQAPAKFSKAGQLLCEGLGCFKHPSFAQEGCKARMCATHKAPGMINVKKMRCEVLINI